MRKLFLIFLLFVPVAIFASYSGVSGEVVFFLSALGIVPLAKYIGEAVEELASRTTPVVGGLLSASFGNITELIIGFFALRVGLVEVVKATITGAILSNLLLVLGLAMLAGGARYTKQTFNRTGVLASSSTLFLAVIALTMPAIFVQVVTNGPGGLELSIFVSGALLAMYALGLLFSLYTHRQLYIEEVGKYEPRWSKRRSILILLISTLLVAWLSNILVNSINPLIAALGWSQLFVGVVFLAIIGNVAENFSAVTVAVKNRMDLSLQIAMGSATQMAMVVAPLLVLVSLLLPVHMDLVLKPFELVSIVLSVLIVNLVVADGESNWLEGAQLFASYLIIAVAFFLHP